MTIINIHQWNPQFHCPLLTTLPFIVIDVYWSPVTTSVIHWQLCINTFLIKSQWPHIPSFSHWQSPSTYSQYLPTSSQRRPPQLLIFSDVYWSFPMTPLTSTNSKVVNEHSFRNDFRWPSTLYLYTYTRVFKDLPTGPLTLQIISLMSTVSPSMIIINVH